MLPTIVKVFRFTAAAGASCAVFLLLLFTSSPQAPTPPRPLEHPDFRVAELVRRHDCWTRSAPADMRDKMPGHVVITRPGRGPVYAGPRTVGPALEQVFAGVDHGLVVNAFCR